MVSDLFKVIQLASSRANFGPEYLSSGLSALSLLQIIIILYKVL